MQIDLARHITIVSLRHKLNIRKYEFLKHTMNEWNRLPVDGVTAACGRTPYASVWCPPVSRWRQRHRISVHVLMCHAVLQLRAAGRHPPQSGVRLSADSDSVTASLHVLMCHAVLQLRAAGRHPPQSGVRLSPAGGRRQRDRHRVSTCPDVSRRVTAACGRTPSAPVWCPSVAYWRTATARPSPRLYMS